MAFDGKRSDFHGFERVDLERAGRSGIVVRPRREAEGRPWLWRARFFDHEPQVDVGVLEHGFHLVYCDVANLFGGPPAVAAWNDFYAFLAGEHGFAPKVALEGFSRGGLIIYNWASENPDKVACIYADAPVCDIKSWPGGKGRGPGAPDLWEMCLASYGLTEDEAMRAKCSPVDRLLPLAQAGVPLLHVVGDADETVPVSDNTDRLEDAYRALGGSIRVIHKPGVGHHPHCLEDPTPIVDFILEHTTRKSEERK